MNSDASAYQERLDYLYGRLNYERLGMPKTSADLRIGRTRRILRALGDPQDDLTIVHVTGTKGKGSTSVMLAAAITASGRSTGLFTSPHLNRLEERLKVDGRDVSRERLIALIDVVRPVVARLDACDPQFQEREATFFEIITALGLLHFATSQARMVVLEVGLGGRLDATNAIHPALAVLTTISHDHNRLLGSTLAAIAREKAGIIKRGTPAVVGVTGDDAMAEIRTVAKLRRAPIREIGRDFRYDYFAPEHPLNQPAAGSFHARTWRTDWGVLEVPLIGAHQARNASVALAALDALAEQGIEVSRQAVEAGFASVSWPARVEILEKSPWLVIDGAHNVESAEALAETLRVNFPAGPRTLVFGTTREKDLPGQLAAILPGFDQVVITRYLENPRAVPVDEAAALVPELTKAALHRAETPAEALEIARRITPGHGLICVTGSLFLAAEVRALVLDEPSKKLDD